MSIDLLHVSMVYSCTCIHGRKVMGSTQGRDSDLEEASEFAISVWDILLLLDQGSDHAT